MFRLPYEYDFSEIAKFLLIFYLIIRQRGDIVICCNIPYSSVNHIHLLRPCLVHGTFLDFATVALSFLFENYYPIVD